MEPPTKTLGDGGPRGPRPKRIKIDLACENCRAKKVKCDGARPTCGSCSRKLNLRDNCRYNDGSAVRTERSTPGTRDDVVQPSPSESGSARGYFGEASVSQLPIEARSEAHSMPQESPAGATPGSRQTDDTQSQRQIGASVCSTTPSGIDSMTAVIDEGASTREFFGISSAGSFTAQIKRAIDLRMRKSGNGQPQQPVSSSASGIGIANSGESLPSDISYVLPPRRQADHLMELYWFYVDPLYPFLDKHRWNNAYNAIFAGTAMHLDERTFVATLNVIFALSTQFLESRTLDHREQFSNTYFRRAQDLMPMGAWDSGSLESVQCLLLTSQYLQSTHQPHQTWMAVGSAIRMAQGLGLHLPETSAERSDPNERELLRRIWYGCVLMDRMVSVTHGRPAMISEPLAVAVPLHVPASATNISVGTPDAEVAGRASFFVESVRLYEIIHQTIIAFYGGSGGRPKKKEAHSSDHETSDVEDEDLDTVVSLDRSLSRWEKRLPSHLRWNSLGVITDEVLRRQTVILRMRFLHARILLFRPLLSRFCLAKSPAERGWGEDNLQACVVEQGAQLCVSTAQSIITTLLTHQTVNGTVGPLPAWWYRVYYVYSAATVLIAAKLRPEAFPRAGICRSWREAISVLQAHEKFGQSARRCVAALHILSSKILQMASGTSASAQGMTSSHGSRNNEGVASSGAPDNPPEMELIEMLQQPVDGIMPPFADLDQKDLADFDLDANDLSWLNDMQAVWEVLNE